MLRLNEDLLEDMTENEKEEFDKRWVQNQYLLDIVDENHISELEDFAYAMDIDFGEVVDIFNDSYFLPLAYEQAVELLYFIEDYFKNKKEVVE